jgi:protein involved in polysaccharide export with SLBB domain
MKQLALAILASAMLAYGQSDRLQYYLAPNDKIMIRAPEAPKINGKTFEIQADGFVSLPSIGRILAGGLTTDALEKQLAKRLKHGSSKEPTVRISVTVVSPGRLTRFDKVAVGWLFLYGFASCVFYSCATAP